MKGRSIPQQAMMMNNFASETLGRIILQPG